MSAKQTLEEVLVGSVLDYKGAYSEKLRDIHTDMIIKASAGDEKAKKYLKECLRQALIKIDKKYKDVKLSQPIIDEVYANNWGLGILDKYDTVDVDELMIHGLNISMEKGGVLINLPEKFKSMDESLATIRRVLEFDSSLDISAKNPKKQGERADGSRITAAIPPIAKVPTLNIRKHKSFVPTTENLINAGTIPQELVALCDIVIRGKANIAVIGEMGSGKTAFIRWLLGFIPKKQQTGVLETTFELHPEELYPEHKFVQMRENADEPGQKLSDLFYLMLRQNVERIIMGEVRSGMELHLYKYACNRGHSGGIMSGHYMNAESFLVDGADMLLEAGLGVDKMTSKLGLATTVDLVFRLVNIKGKRVLASLEEVICTDGYSYEVSPIWAYEWGENEREEDGRHVLKNDISPVLRAKLESYGVHRYEIDAALRVN